MLQIVFHDVIDQALDHIYMMHDVTNDHAWNSRNGMKFRSSYNEFCIWWLIHLITYHM